MRISEFEWDEGNTLHLELGHGITPEEVEEVFANQPLFRRTKKGHYVAFGPTSAGVRTISSEQEEGKEIARPITGWDMKRVEIRYYKSRRSRR